VKASNDCVSEVKRNILTITPIKPVFKSKIEGIYEKDYLFDCGYSQARIWLKYLESILTSKNSYSSEQCIWSLTNSEQTYYKSFARSMMNLICSIPCVKEVELFGSLCKGTAIPGYFDIDIAVILESSDLSALSAEEMINQIKEHLMKEKGVEFYYESPLLLKCLYDDIKCDLVIIDSKESMTYQSLIVSATLLNSVRKRKEELLDVIRVMKYLNGRIKHLGDINKKLKSVVLELIF
jgi:predicted nucleotidyltransferase